jgi:hypothetical protein
MRKPAATLDAQPLIRNRRKRRQRLSTGTTGSHSTQHKPARSSTYDQVLPWVRGMHAGQKSPTHPRRSTVRSLELLIEDPRHCHRRALSDSRPLRSGLFGLACSVWLAPRNMSATVREQSRRSLYGPSYHPKPGKSGPSAQPWGRTLWSNLAWLRPGAGLGHSPRLACRSTSRPGM